MKKIILVTISLLLALTATFFALDHQQMKQGNPVYFSTWGKKYAPVENPRSVQYFQAFSYGHPEEIEFGESKSYVIQTLEEQTSFNKQFTEANPLTAYLNYDKDFYSTNSIIVTIFWSSAVVNPTEYALTSMSMNKNDLTMEITYTPTPGMSYGQAMTPFYQVLELTKQKLEAENIKVLFK